MALPRAAVAPLEDPRDLPLIGAEIAPESDLEIEAMDALDREEVALLDAADM